MRECEVLTIGVDSTIHVDPTTFEATCIDVHDTVVGLKTFRVIQEIHRPIIPFGCGTHIYIVQEMEDGPLYVLKDSWYYKSTFQNSIFDLI